MKAYFKYGVLLLLVAVSQAQRTNTQYVDQYPGGTVAAKTAAAQAACNPVIPCVLVFDSDLAGYAQGSMPARGANESWWDYTHTGQTFYNGSAVGSGGGGSPGGISGNLQVDNAGSFGGINGTSFSNNANLSTGSINSIAITPVAPTGAGSLTNSQHALNVTMDDQVSSVGSGTDSGIYDVCSNHATGGAFGHQLCVVSRATNATVGASSISLVAPYYGDYTQSSTDTVNEADLLNNGGFNISSGTLSLGVGVNIGTGPSITGSGHVTSWDGFLAQAPVASVAGLTTSVSANFGNCNPNFGTGWYVNLVVCGGESDFQSPLNIKTHPAATPAAPVTNVAPYAITMSQEIDADVSGGAGSININSFGLNASGSISLIAGLNSLAQQENTGTATEADALRAGYSVSGGGTITKAVGLHVISPTGTSTVTQGYGVYIDTLATSVTNTNPPVAVSTSDGFEVRSKWAVDKNGSNFYFTQAAPANPPAGEVLIYANSTSGNIACLTSSGGSCLPGTGTTVTVASGTSAALPTTAQSSGVCTAITQTGLSGLLSTDSFLWAIDSNVTNIQWFNVLPQYVSATSFTFNVCNISASSETLGGTVHLVWRVVR